MTPRRPGWWPRALWPGAKRPGEPPGGLPDRPSPRGEESSAPEESFLELVVAAFGARGASVYRLERERAVWVLERRAGEPAPSSDELSAAGHPLTWCLREGVLMQVEAGDLLDPRASGWALAGAAPPADRALVVQFAGSPPSGAREGLQAAVRHLSALHDDDASGPPSP